MKLKLFGALVGAAMLALAAPAGAATFNGTNAVNVDKGTLTTSPTHFDINTGGGGIMGADFTTGQSYFDVIVKFTLAATSDVTITSTPTVSTAGGDPRDYHTALFSPQPSGTGMFFDTNNGHNINLLGSLTTAGDGDTTLSATGLAAGDYFLHLFGVINGHGKSLTALSGDIAFSAVAQTPLPAGLLLFATGLGGLGFAAWRRKAAAPTAAA